MIELIIFDFDGVVADSEWLANRNLAESLTRIGLATTPEEAIQHYMGRRWPDCVSLIEQRLGSSLSEDFLADLDAGHAQLIAQIKPVLGLETFLRDFAATPRCIASSSTLTYIGECLEVMKLSHWFASRFSGHDVPRGKPYPDLFLKAAAMAGVHPSACLVIEDSTMGVMAGRAAGMLTFGLCAGSHIRSGHAELLQKAGADEVFTSYAGISQSLKPRTI